MRPGTASTARAEEEAVSVDEDCHVCPEPVERIVELLAMTATRVKTPVTC